MKILVLSTSFGNFFKVLLITYFNKLNVFKNGKLFFCQMFCKIQSSIKNDNVNLQQENVAMHIVSRVDPNQISLSLRISDPYAHGKETISFRETFSLPSIKCCSVYRDNKLRQGIAVRPCKIRQLRPFQEKIKRDCSMVTNYFFYRES